MTETIHTDPSPAQRAWGEHRTSRPRNVEDLRSDAAAIDWYHTVELAPGVLSPGWFDTRLVVERLPMPADLSGHRCLDVGSFDGFWAFTMERRGALEVVAVDVPDPTRWDWPADATPEVVASVASRRPGAGFALAASAFESKVRRVETSVYELDEATLGQFDFIYVGSLLLHLRDPVGALTTLRHLCRGSLLLFDAVEMSGWPKTPRARLDGRGRPWWWKPNVAGLVRMVEAAGFSAIDVRPSIRVPAGAGQPRPGISTALFKALPAKATREALWRAYLGDRHAAVLAVPSH